MKLIDSIAYSDLKFSHKIYLKTEKFTIHLFAFMRGQSLSEHTADSNAFLTILDGNAKIVINGEEQVLGVNDTFVIPKNIPHSVHGIENFKMMLIK